MFEDYSFFSFCKLLRRKKKCFLNKPGVLRILVFFLRYNKKLDTQINMVVKKLNPQYRVNVLHWKLRHNMSSLLQCFEKMRSLTTNPSSIFISKSSNPRISGEALRLHLSFCARAPSTLMTSWRSRIASSTEVRAVPRRITPCIVPHWAPHCTSYKNIDALKM